MAVVRGGIGGPGACYGPNSSLWQFLFYAVISHANIALWMCSCLYTVLCLCGSSIFIFHFIL